MRCRGGSLWRGLAAPHEQQRLTPLVKIDGTYLPVKYVHEIVYFKTPTEPQAELPVQLEAASPVFIMNLLEPRQAFKGN